MGGQHFPSIRWQDNTNLRPTCRNATSEFQGLVNCHPNYNDRLDELAWQYVARRLRFEQLVVSAQILMADADVRLTRPTLRTNLPGDRGT